MTKKYLKTYERTIMHGRDMGYSETVKRKYDSFEELLRDFGTQPNEEHFELIELDKEQLQKQVDEIKVSKLTETEKKEYEIQQKINALSVELEEVRASKDE